MSWKILNKILKDFKHSAPLLSIIVLLCLTVSRAWAEDGVKGGSSDVALADSIVKYQMASGGWAKNQDWLKGCDRKYMEECFRTGVGSTIDNGATTSELKTLARVMRQEGKEDARYRAAFVRGVQYLLTMQYGNGGWPQFFPPRAEESYANHITFNDEAMVRVMRLLWDVAERRGDVGSVTVPDNMPQACRLAFWRGVGCILRCQIRDREGRLTVWCQQHDEVTLKPASARRYELASYCGSGETVGILTLLMDILDSHPDFYGTGISEKELRNSIGCAVQWLELHPIRDMRIEEFVNAEGRPDKRMVPSAGAPLLWARYYDLENAQPLYSDRRGLPLSDFNSIEFERRNGYQWVGDSPQRVILRWRNH